MQIVMVEARFYETTCSHVASCPCEVKERTVRIPVEVFGKTLMLDESAYFTDEDELVEWLETTDAGQRVLKERLEFDRD